jgi:phytanoyl-CoA hydroxylase
MRAEVTGEQVQRYREDGFLVVPNLLDSAELERWRATIEEALRDRGDHRLPGERWKAGEDAFYDLVFTQRINLWQSSPEVKALILDERIGKMAADLAGIDGIRVHHDQALFKPPFGNPTAYHLDDPYWPFSTRDAISVWVALDDATLENGCLYYLPGTHRSATFDNVGIGKEIGALFDVYPQWRDIAPVACPVAAGGCVFHNGLIAHGAGANMTPGPRRAMTCAYMPEGSTFNGQQNILDDEYFASLTIGDLLDDESRNPLVFSRAVSSSQ